MKPHDGTIAPSLPSEFTLKSQSINNESLNGYSDNVIATTGRHVVSVKYDQDVPFEPKTKISSQKYMRSKAERRRQLVDELKHVYNYNKNKEEFTSIVTPRMDRQTLDLKLRFLKSDVAERITDQSFVLRRTGTVPASIMKQRSAEKEDMLDLKRSNTEFTFDTKPRPPKTVKRVLLANQSGDPFKNFSIEGIQILEVEPEVLGSLGRSQTCYNLKSDPNVARYALLSQLKPMIEPVKVIKLSSKLNSEPKKMTFKNTAPENTLNDYWHSKRKKMVRDVSVRFADKVKTQNQTPLTKTGLSASDTMQKFNQSNAMKLMRQLSNT